MVDINSIIGSNIAFFDNLTFFIYEFRGESVQGCDTERIPVLTPERARLTCERGTRCVSGEKPVLKYVYKPVVVLHLCFVESTLVNQLMSCCNDLPI
jgi:hypothetical protein